MIAVFDYCWSLSVGPDELIFSWFLWSEFDSSIGRQIFDMGLVRMSSTVLIDATRVTPSSSGCISTMRFNFYHSDARFSSFITTIVPTPKAFDTMSPVCFAVEVGTDSRHCFQNCWYIACSSWKQVRRFILTSVMLE